MTSGQLTAKLSYLLTAINKNQAQDLILQYNTMKLVTTSLSSSGIKSKKNSILNKQMHSDFATPVKHFAEGKTQDSTGFQHISTPYKLANFHNQGESLLQMKQIPHQPKNAFQKKCFSNRRSIKHIKDLQKIYEQRPISKSLYKFRANRSLSEKGMISSNSYAAFHKKGVKDRLPFNIMALETVFKDHSSPKLEKLDKLSHSKRIKYRIIGNSYDC